jgi:hypothetical protein
VGYPVDHIVVGEVFAFVDPAVVVLVATVLAVVVAVEDTDADETGLTPELKSMW